MTLDEEIAESQSFAADPPKNESNTCEWIILPLLRACGYARRDIVSRAGDNGGKFPDYTLLPDVPLSAWYLEAKAWSVVLEDNHAMQALNYANHNGKRFVVLTNGQVWRFYDNSIQGLPKAKLISHAALHNTAEITDFLASISKTEVLGDGLERYAEKSRARNERAAIELREVQEREAEERRLQHRQSELLVLLDETLPDQLRDPTSDLVFRLNASLSSKCDFSGLTAQTLARWFDRSFCLRPNEIVPASPGPSHQQFIPAPSVEAQGQRTLNLRTIQGIPINGKGSRPVALHTPDGKQVAVHSWVLLAEYVVAWLLAQPRVLPIPFEGTNRSRWFLNETAQHKHPDRRKKFAAISVNQKTIFMDKDLTAEDFMKNLFLLCIAIQLPPDGFRITLM